MASVDKPVETITDWAATGDKEKPNASKANLGWEADEEPPYQWFNWLQNMFTKWINWLNGMPIGYDDSGVLNIDQTTINNIQSNTGKVLTTLEDDFLGLKNVSVIQPLKQVEDVLSLADFNGASGILDLDGLSPVYRVLLTSALSGWGAFIRSIDSNNAPLNSVFTIYNEGTYPCKIYNSNFSGAHASANINFISSGTEFGGGDTGFEYITLEPGQTLQLIKSSVSEDFRPLIAPSIAPLEGNAIGVVSFTNTTVLSLTPFELATGNELKCMDTILGIVNLAYLDAGFNHYASFYVWIRKGALGLALEAYTLIASDTNPSNEPIIDVTEKGEIKATFSTSINRAKMTFITMCLNKHWA